MNQIIDKLAPPPQQMKVIKTIRDALIQPTTIIINQMLTTGIFPDKFKIAKIIPVYKKDNKTVFTNYRPI